MSENTIIDTEAPMAGACSPLQLRPIPGETLDSFEGFMCYFNLGHNRTLKGVAEKLHLNISTVKEWSAKHHWVDRILEYEAYLFNTRINSDAAAVQELALAKVERESLRRQTNTKLSNFLMQLAEILLEHHPSVQTTRRQCRGTPFNSLTILIKRGVILPSQPIRTRSNRCL